MRGGGTTRIEDASKDGGTEGDDGNKAICGDNDIRHPNQQTTNNRGKQMLMTGLCGTKRIEDFSQQRAVARQEMKADGKQKKEAMLLIPNL